MAKIDNPYKILLSEEQRILLKTRKLREDIVDHFIKYKEGFPTKGSEIRVINEVLNSLDNQVLGLVDKRLKHDENKANSENAEAIAGLLRKLSEQKSLSKPIENTEISDKYVPDDIVPGEDSMEYEEIELKDILKEE